MFQSVTLEMSLKPFKKTDPDYIQHVCHTLFEQWRPLLKNRAVISVMLWAADGSELLDYTGDLDREFEWCRFLGNANLPDLGDLPVETGLHIRRQPYISNPPKMTYRILKTIIAAIKEEGQRQFPHAKIHVGETFDIGPEFAISDFKYHRHPEVCSGTGCDRLGFVDATALLKGDQYPYAAYPNGVPDGTPLGTLLGAQSNIFLKEMGFDYIWLSNGMGFCYEPWNETGKIYDGKRFYPEKLPDTKEKVFRFWQLFRDACPDIPIHTRGTNYSVGMDYAGDGVPLYDIYKGNFNITPPPNSPWAALNDDFGIEILGQLTRNCELPGNDFMFRFYIHDIWWMNSPWYDRYESNPHDIYLPMALSRIDESGHVQTPTLFNILSVDNSLGDLPDACVYEPLPHILKAEKDAPDDIAPLVLLYPMREYTTAKTEKMLREMYFCDSFMRHALNIGFPLSGVVSTDNFLKHEDSLYSRSILVVPAAFDNPSVQNKLNRFANNGGKMIVYGSKEALEQIHFPCAKVDIEDSPSSILEVLEQYNTILRFSKESTSSPLPTMTVHRSDNAMFFSVYNRDTTVKTQFKFPLGAPILMGYNTVLQDGCAVYQFPRSAHAECRIFVKQNSGILRAREISPVSRKYRRIIAVYGLQNADVFCFPEEYCKTESMVGTATEEDGVYAPLSNWELVNDPQNGTFIHVKNASETIYLCMPFPDQL